ncbi:izumo sperm-egg fusion protein 1 [Fundulus heteroclitus]|uniref:izumo sperm-egg fusion protein 1 n=1 Tax=Fundulus heteroclitus TaxID=8078 RepID=UPI00165AA393|nr:izumo sperm-egg fusion protein 1 [Fundulus heteroclitus]
MLVILVPLIYCILTARACLQCDRTIRNMHDDFILSAPTVSEQIELQKICDYAYVTYRDTSQNRKGIIDPTTLYRAKTEYQSEFDRFLKTKPTGSLTFETIQIMEKGRKILEKHLDAFIPDGLCPNKCGKLAL